jgi:hypothetical protein
VDLAQALSLAAAQATPRAVAAWLRALAADEVAGKKGAARGRAASGNRDKGE